MHTQRAQTYTTHGYCWASTASALRALKDNKLTLCNVRHKLSDSDENHLLCFEINSQVRLNLLRHLHFCLTLLTARNNDATTHSSSLCAAPFWRSELCVSTNKFRPNKWRMFVSRPVVCADLILSGQGDETASMGDKRKNALTVSPTAETYTTKMWLSLNSFTIFRTGNVCPIWSGRGRCYHFEWKMMIKTD